MINNFALLCTICVTSEEFEFCSYAINSNSNIIFHVALMCVIITFRLSSLKTLLAQHGRMLLGLYYHHATCDLT